MVGITQLSEICDLHLFVYEVFREGGWGGGGGVHVADLLQIKLKLVQMKKIHKGFSSKIKNG